MKRFTVDGRGVRSFDDLVTAMNLGFVRQVRGAWNGNLDAFSDYLSWPEEGDYELELLGSDNCIAHLGHVAQADWLREHIRTCHPSNVADMQSGLERADAGEGQTLFDVIREIIAASPHVHLVLR